MQIKAAKYSPAPRIAGTLEEELAAERQRKGTTARGVSYEIIKNRGLTPHKSKLNRNPRVKKREAYRKAVIRRKGQVVDVSTTTSCFTALRSIIVAVVVVASALIPSHNGCCTETVCRSECCCLFVVRRRLQLYQHSGRTVSINVCSSFSVHCVAQQ
jgi:Sas10 C-terminal domain